MSLDLGDQLLRTDLGSYALYAPVASGGFGTVYFGRDLQNNRAVAIKRLHGHLAYQPAVVERFQQEAQRLRGLQHPNIVQVLDDGTDSKGLPFIILQWVEGWTVAALLEQSGRFAIAEAVEIACQVLAALEAAGRRGVVHRDIKPSNLMVTPPPDRQVKVMDFGIAKDILANVNSQYTQIGTIAYMAPEQFTQAAVDARTDLYALGVTLYELLAGQKPSGALTPESPTSLRELRPEVDPALAAIVYRALEKRPVDRFENPAQMRTALEPFVGRGADLTILGPGSSAPPIAGSQTHLADLYSAARQALEARAWPKAVELLEAIIALDAGYRDAATVLAEARRQRTLAELYGEARELGHAQAWQAVLIILDRIRALDAAFDDAEALEHSAREALAAEQRRLAAQAPPTGDPSVIDVTKSLAQLQNTPAASDTAEPQPTVARIDDEQQTVLLTNDRQPAVPPTKDEQHLIASADAGQATVFHAAKPQPVRHRIGEQSEPVRPDGAERAPHLDTPDAGAAGSADDKADGRRSRRRIGTPIWAGGAIALLAIGVVVAQQFAGGQTRPSGDPTLAPLTQSIDVAPPSVALALPTADLAPTESPRAEIPPVAVPTSTPAPTSTAASTATTAPTATPTVDDLWRVALVQLDPTWSRDWPKSIELLNAFLAAHPGFAPGEDKLYAARLFYADELLAAGDPDGAVEQLDAAATLLPQRSEAKQALVALTPTPTATAIPAVVVPRSQPVVPAQPRTQPAPVQPAPARQAPAQAPPPAPPLVP